MKKLYVNILSLTLFFALFGLNFNIIEGSLSYQNEAQAEAFYCYDTEWETNDTEITGGGCTASEQLCYIISNEADCTHYYFTGTDGIIVTPD